MLHWSNGLKQMAFFLVFVGVFPVCKSTFQTEPVRFRDDQAFLGKVEGSVFAEQVGSCKVMSKDHIIYALLVFPLNTATGPVISKGTTKSVRIYKEINIVDGVITVFGALLGFRAESVVVEDCDDLQKTDPDVLTIELARLEKVGVPLTVANLKSTGRPKSFRHVIYLKGQEIKSDDQKVEKKKLEKTKEGRPEKTSEKTSEKISEKDSGKTPLEGIITDVKDKSIQFKGEGETLMIENIKISRIEILSTY